MSDNKCNGWTNYATWRINLELINDYEFVEEDLKDGKIDADLVKDIVENWVFDNHSGHMGLMEDYARAFIDQVNFHEIANHINDELEHIKERENEANEYE